MVRSKSLYKVVWQCQIWVSITTQKNATWLRSFHAKTAFFNVVIKHHESKCTETHQIQTNMNPFSFFPYYCTFVFMTSRTFNKRAMQSRNQLVQIQQKELVFNQGLGFNVEIAFLKDGHIALGWWNKFNETYLIQWMNNPLNFF